MPFPRVFSIQSFGSRQTCCQETILVWQWARRQIITHSRCHDFDDVKKLCDRSPSESRQDTNLRCRSHQSWSMFRRGIAEAHLPIPSSDSQPIPSRMPLDCANPQAYPSLGASFFARLLHVV